MGHQEQSVDDILASIRRIIAEDVPDRDGSPRAQSPASEDEPQPTVEFDDYEDEDEPLLLSDPAPPQAAPQSAVPGRGQHDVLLLSDPLDPIPGMDAPKPSQPRAGSADRPASPATGEGPGERAHAGPQVPRREPFGADGDRARSTGGHSRVGAEEPSGDRADLLSQATRQAVAEALAHLESETSDRLNQATANQSIEDLVRTALKPVLRDWLDNHLPGMVQTIVEDEIARVKRRDRR